MMPLTVRVRLTLWYMFVFGLLLTIILSFVYFAYQKAHYKDIDQLLTSISMHINEELDQQIEKRGSLNNANLFLDQLLVSGVRVTVQDLEGNTLFSNSKSDFNQINQQSKNSKINNELPRTINDPFSGIEYRILIKPVKTGNKLYGYIISDIELTELNQSLVWFKRVIITLSVIGFIFATIGGWYLAKKTLRRVELIRQTAKSIASSQEFDKRVSYIGPKDELGELAETFNQMLNSLEKVYLSQKRFIADASHELRAPLTTIRGNIDILSKVKDIPRDDFNDILYDTQEEIKRMSKLVNYLLSLARADAGQELSFEIVDLSTMLKSLENELNYWSKEVSIDFMYQNNLLTLGDYDQLKQLLLILIENAFRYTNKGGRVTVKGYRENDEVVIYVADTGLGIKKDDLPLIFERFYRGENARAIAADGSGLGLSIAKWIINQHRGEIKVNSKIGKGTEIIIYLPGES